MSKQNQVRPVEDQALPEPPDAPEPPETPEPSPSQNQPGRHKQLDRQQLDRQQQQDRQDQRDQEAEQAQQTARTGQTAPDVAELEDRWKRALADLDNLRKRYARDLPRELEAERARVAAAFLPVVDNLELALAHADSDPGAIVKGVEAVRDQAVAALRSLGYPRHDEVGVPFDPMRHDVATVVDDPDVEPGTVVQLLRPGYGEPDRQLRPATVAVSRKRE